MSSKVSVEAQLGCNVATGLGEEKPIRTTPYPKCILCGCEGQLLHSNQHDRLFCVSGSWNFKICSDRKCGLIWLDPMPIKEDLWKAYLHYYTHEPLDQVVRVGLPRRIYRLMKRGYWVGKYNYPGRSGSFMVKMLGKLLYLFPIRRGEIDAEARFLHAIPEGCLLDVGCGSGEWLAFMSELGWRVEGVDFDENAVRVARQKGLKVHCGSLEQQNFPDGTFDAVTLNHVIEHIPDPISTLAECIRILKPSGKLVLFTPNASSLGRKVFKENWRGLEPPRHLHIFSTRSIVRLLESAGFKHVSVKPQASFFVIYKTLLLQWGQTGLSRSLWLDYFARFLAKLINGVEFCLVKWNPSLAECMAAVAVKK
jgi:2-polyprenyl-3-methyl-5-hydroxy-6-metoxy-1,4-benzoquinol methylase